MGLTYLLPFQIILDEMRIGLSEVKENVDRLLEKDEKYWTKDEQVFALELEVRFNGAKVNLQG